MKWLWVSFVTTGMFLVRMALLALMSLLQLTLGGAPVRPTAKAAA
jgi:hypothetical protein